MWVAAKCRSPECLRHHFYMEPFYFCSLDVGTTPNVTRNFGSMDLFSGSTRRMVRNGLDTLLKPECSLHWAAFYVCRPNHLGQHSALDRTIETLKIDVYCVSEARIEDPTSVITSRGPDIISISSLFICPVIQFKAFMARLALGSF